MTSLPTKGLAVEAFLLRDGHTGVERYILNLIGALSENGTCQVTVFILTGCNFTFSPPNPCLHFKRIPVKTRVLRILFQHFAFPFWLQGYKKVFFTGYLGSLLFPAKKTAIAVFDLIALERPELVKRSTRWYYSLLLPWFIRKADILFVPSEKTRIGISQMNPIGSIVKVPIPIDDAFYEDQNAPTAYSITDRKAILVVGFGEKKKNHALLRQISPCFPEIDFWLVGKSEAREQFPENVHQFGFVLQAQLVRMFRQADVLGFLSFEEGYGLPIYEALVSGTPVLTWKTAPFTEIHSPLLYHPISPDLQSYIQSLKHILLAPKPSTRTPFQLIRWSEYWSTIELELLRA